jgi:hypothetical protein
MREFGLPEAFIVGLEVTHVTLLERNVNVALFQIALNLVLADAFANDVVARPTQFSKQILYIATMMLSDVFFACDAANHLAAIAAGRAPAYFVRFDNMYVIAALGQVQGGGYACESRTDYTNVGRVFASEWREVSDVIDGGRVIRAGVWLRVLHRQVSTADLRYFSGGTHLAL